MIWCSYCQDNINPLMCISDGALQTIEIMYCPYCKHFLESEVSTEPDTNISTTIEVPTVEKEDK